MMQLEPTTPLTLFFLGGAILGTGLVIWSYTPWGKNYIKHLDD